MVNHGPDVIHDKAKSTTMGELLKVSKVQK